MNRQASLCLWIGLLTAGCAAPTTAVVNGREVPRQTVALTGQPYHVRHAGAHPAPGHASGGLRDGGGALAGQVCGMSIDYEVTHEGDHVQLAGFVDGSLPSQIRVEDRLGFPVFTGSLGSRVVNLQLFGDRLRGYVGRWPIDLRQQGDALVGAYFARVVSAETRVPLRLTGLDALWRMTPAQQAAVLPLMVACVHHFIFEDFGREAPQMGFGGPAGALPAHTLVLDRGFAR